MHRLPWTCETCHAVGHHCEFSSSIIYILRPSPARLMPRPWLNRSPFAVLGDGPVPTTKSEPLIDVLGGQQTTAHSSLTSGSRRSGSSVQSRCARPPIRTLHTGAGGVAHTDSVLAARRRPLHPCARGVAPPDPRQGSATARRHRSGPLPREHPYQRSPRYSSRPVPMEASATGVVCRPD